MRPNPHMSNVMWGNKNGFPGLFNFHGGALEFLDLRAALVAHGGSRKDTLGFGIGSFVLE